MEAARGNARHAPSLLRTLRPPLKNAKTLYDATVHAWFSAHDGQTPSAKPLFRGFRLLSHAEAEARWKRARGDGYRPDWNDSWKVLGVASGKRLLCYDSTVTSVSEVDISVAPYRKQRICFGMARDGWTWRGGHPLESRPKVS